MIKNIFFAATVLFSVPSEAAVLGISAFYQQYENPTEVITFTHLKDGTIHDGTFSPLIVSITSNGKTSVRAEAWSNNFDIASKNQGACCEVHLAATWDGASIAPELYNSLFVTFNSDQTFPMAIYSSEGFFGIPPATVRGYYFELPGLATISKIEYGFSSTTPTVPLPSAVIMFIPAVLMLFGFGRREPR